MTHEGGCLCGKVRFKAEGEPVNVRLCHCRLCQQAFAAPFNARAFYLAGQVSYTGEVGRHPTSDRILRAFCPACGTRVWSERADGFGYGLPLANFDDRNAFTPTHHIWVSEKPDWLVLNDGLPQFPENPPA